MYDIDYIPYNLPYELRQLVHLHSSRLVADSRRTELAALALAEAYVHALGLHAKT